MTFNKVNLYKNFKIIGSAHNPLEIKKTIQLIEPKCVVPIGFEDSTDHPFVNDLIKFCDSLPAKLVVPKLDEIYKVD